MASKPERWCLCIVVIAQSLLSAGCALPLQGEPLGGEFKRVGRVANGESGAARVDHLYFRNADLGAVGYVSVAPSARHAIFERKGTLFLITSDGGDLRPIAAEIPGPWRVHWLEREGQAEIWYGEGLRESSRIDLD
jgi:hypothetical protein